MLPPKPQLLVSTATALGAWYGEMEPWDADDTDRDGSDARRALCSLRFVNFVGFWSYFDMGPACSSWPLPRVEQIEELAEFAEQHHALEAIPAIGDVFALASFDASRPVLAGIIVSLDEATTMLNGSLQFVCTTIEGEVEPVAGEPAAAPLITARLVRRRLSAELGDLFIRWCRLQPASAPAAIEYELPADVVRLRRRRSSKRPARVHRAFEAKVP